MAPPGPPPPPVGKFPCYKCKEEFAPGQEFNQHRCGGTKKKGEKETKQKEKKEKKHESVKQSGKKAIKKKKSN